MPLHTSTPMSKKDYVPMTLFKYLCFESFRHQHAMSNFLDAALRESDMDRLVCRLSEENGPNLLTQILKARFKPKVRNASRFGVSFQAVALKLCKLLSHPHVRRSSQATARRAIFKLVAETPSFFELSIRCFAELVAEADQRDLSDESLRDFLLVVETCMEEHPDLCEHSLWTDMLKTLRDISGSFNHWGKTDFADDIQRSLDFIAERTELKVWTEDGEPAWLPFAKANGPGDLRSKGPRHDNDATCFRDIEIYPTVEEIMCCEAPYLPLNTGPGSEHSSAWLARKTEVNMDIQFRLIREDLTRTFRIGIRSFIKGATLDLLIDGLATFDVEEGRSNGQFFVWTDASFLGLDSNYRRGMSLSYSVINPGSLHTFSIVTEDQAAIMGNRLFQTGSLVCVAIKRLTSAGNTDWSPSRHEICDEPQTQATKSGAHQWTIVWCHVTSMEDESKPEEPRKEVSLAPVRNQDFDTLLRHTPVFGAEHANELYILQLKGHFATAHEEALRTLKTLQLERVPFGRRICHREIAPAQARMNAKARHLASYIKPNVCYDVSMLSDDTEIKWLLNGVRADEPNSLETILKDCEDRICLEGTQISAFVRGLTEEVALIQGPPGCGKTYIGVKIVAALLKNRALISALTAADEKENGDQASDERTPILCVCFTNHALDQFLESLLSTGCVGLEDIVRIGSRSGSEIIKQRTLPTVLRQQPFKQRPPPSMFKCINLGDEIVSWTAALSDSVSDRFVDWLSEHHDGFLGEIRGDDVNSSDLHALIDYEPYVQDWLSCDDSVEAEARSQRLRDLRRAFGDYAVSKVESLRKELEEARRSHQEDEASTNVKMLRKMKIVGCTTSGAARNCNMLRALGASIVVCEEAAEVNEGQLLGSLSASTKQFILIGDHLQLPPKTEEYSLTAASGLGHGFDISLFERLARDCVVPHVTLSTQRRMHPHIANLARLDTYPMLKDANAVRNYPPYPRGFTSPVYFLDHDSKETVGGDEGGKSTSLTNEFEIDVITALTKYVIAQGHKPDQIAVLTPYRAQLKQIKHRFENEQVLAVLTERDEEEIELDEIADLQAGKIDEDASSDLDGSEVEEDEKLPPKLEMVVEKAMTDCVRLATIDKFQGEEADVVLISIVRCNERGSIGFLSSSNRTNVMLTRARHGMYIIGSARTILATDNTLLQKTVAYLQTKRSVGNTLELECMTHGNRTTVSTASDFDKDHGCGDACDVVLPCSHRCDRKCHPQHEHVLMRCAQPCGKVFSCCGHLCPKPCSEPCGNCEVPVIVSLPCGHTTNRPCGQVNNGTIVCTVVVDADRPRPCGHNSDLLCHEISRGRSACQSRCDIRQPCGHKCGEVCHYLSSCNPNNAKCSQHCGKELPCGHLCTAKCHGSNACPPCNDTCLLPGYQTMGTRAKCTEVFYDCVRGVWGVLCKCGAHRVCVSTGRTCSLPPCTLDCHGRKAILYTKIMQDELQNREKMLGKFRERMEKMVVRHRNKRNHHGQQLGAKDRSIQILDARKMFTDALHITEDVKKMVGRIKSESAAIGCHFLGTENDDFTRLVAEPLSHRAKQMTILVALLRARAHCRVAIRGVAQNAGQEERDEDKQRIREVGQFVEYVKSNWELVMHKRMPGPIGADRNFLEELHGELWVVMSDLRDVGAGRVDIVYDAETLAKSCVEECHKVDSMLKGGRPSQSSGEGNNVGSLSRAVEGMQIGNTRSTGGSR